MDGVRRKVEDCRREGKRLSCGGAEGFSHRPAGEEYPRVARSCTRRAAWKEVLLICTEDESTLPREKRPSATQLDDRGYS